MTENSSKPDSVTYPGSIALVTGASRGIGRAVTRSLVAKDMRVIATGRHLDQLEALRDEFGELVIPFVLDVTDADAVAVLPGSLPEDLRRIDVLINNAGHDIGGRRPFTDGTAGEWAAIIETNVNGLMRISRALVPGMLERGCGHIVNLGSVSGLFAYAGGTAYNASKFAVHGFSDALRKDLAATDIRVTEILPGMVRTDFGATRFGGDEEAAAEYYDQFADCLAPDDIAASVMFALEQPGHISISQLVIEPTLLAHPK